MKMRLEANYHVSCHPRQEFRFEALSKKVVERSTTHIGSNRNPHAKSLPSIAAGL
jgi:hypothetical protein